MIKTLDPVVVTDFKHHSPTFSSPSRSDYSSCSIWISPPFFPNFKLHSQMGSKIVYSKHSGIELELDGSNHLLLKEDDNIVSIPNNDDVKDLKLLNDRVLINVTEVKEKTAGGLLLTEATKEKPYIGKMGSKIVYSKHLGIELELDGSNHLLLKEDDIVSILNNHDVKDIKLLNDRVLINVAEVKEKTAGGLLLTEATKEKPYIGKVK